MKRPMKNRVVGGVRTVMMMAVFLFSLVAVPPARADVWGAAIVAANLSQTLTKIQDQINGVLLVTLKSTAITLMNTRVASLLDGSKQSIGTIWECE